MSEAKIKQVRKSNKLPTAITPEIGTVVQVSSSNVSDDNVFGVVTAVSQLNFTINRISEAKDGCWVRRAVPFIDHTWEEMPATEAELVAAAACNTLPEGHAPDRPLAIPNLVSCIKDKAILCNILEYSLEGHHRKNETLRDNGAAALKQLTPTDHLDRIRQIGKEAGRKEVMEWHLSFIGDQSDEVLIELALLCEAPHIIRNILSRTGGKESVLGLLAKMKGLMLDTAIRLIKNTDVLVELFYQACRKQDGDTFNISVTCAIVERIVALDGSEHMKERLINVIGCVDHIDFLQALRDDGIPNWLVNEHIDRLENLKNSPAP